MMIMMMMMRSLSIFVVCMLSYGSALNTCDRNYMKVGCYDEYKPLLKDLVVYERFEIQWNNIENYIHHLACTCEEEIRGLNKVRSAPEKYAGFALHFWGECYGKTQSQIEKVAGMKMSTRCTGDKSYAGCFASNQECTGHAFSEYVFRLRPQPGETQEVNACNDGSIAMGCSVGAYVIVQKVSYAPRTRDTCGTPLTTNWRPECATVSNVLFSKIIHKCYGHATCDIAEWENNPSDSCPGVLKYLKITYFCGVKK